VFQVLRLSPYEPDKRQGEGEGTFKILVLSVDLSGPSDKGVLHKGDVLVGIDGRSINGKSWEQVSPQIQGHLGSFVNLSFERQGIQKSNPSEGDNPNFGHTLQREVSARATMDKQLQYSLRVLRGGHRVVRTNAVWPDPDTYTRTSLFIFSRQLKVRRLAIFISESYVFDKFILLCIMMSSVLLVIVDPLDNPSMRPHSPLRDSVDIASQAFTCFFVLEALIQIVARGLCFGKTAYLKDGWNFMDLLVIMIGILDMIPSLSSSNLSALRALRVRCMCACV
jgi:hypothetical protein